MKKTKNRSTRQSVTLPRPVFSAGKIPLCVGLAVLIAPAMLQAANLDSATTNTSSAKSATHSFNIAKQPLYAALNTLAEQAGVQFVFTEEMVKGLSSPGVSGQLSIEEALTQALKGTGLGYQISNGNTVTLETKPVEAPSGNAAPSTLPAVKVVGKGVYDSTDPYNDNYRHPNSSTATKTDTPIMETPFSVKAIPQQVLQDQQAIRVDKAVENVSGVIRSGANTLQRDTYTIRGFDTGGAGNTYRDGVIFPQGLSQLSAPREVANLQQVEVLKGPASLLFGRAEPGGVINYVTKKPLDTPYYSLQQQFGSYDLYRTTADATGSVTQDKSLLYRFNLAYENANSFRDFASNEQVFIAPVLKWQISPKTQITFELEYQNWDRRPAVGIPTIGNQVASVPIQTNFAGSNSLSNNKGDRVLGGFNWSHDFNENWKLSQSFQVNSIDYTSALVAVNPPALPNGNTTRSVFNALVHDDTYSTSLNLVGKFNTWALKHTSLFGFDYFRLDDNYSSAGNTQSNFNIFTPNYNVNFSQLPATSPFKRNATVAWYGLYYQDQVELPFNLFALGGVRYDASENIDNLASTTSNNHRVNPRGGLLWRPMKEFSLYGSYTENFGANNGFDGKGNSLNPQTAQQWEIGTKTELWDGRFSATLAYYDLTKQNISVTDPNDRRYSTTIGAAETRGIEFDVAGEIIKGWKIIGGYAYMPFAEVTNDVGSDGGPRNTGKRLPLAPRHSGSIWNTYEFQAGDLQGLKFGAGVVTAGQRQGSPANTYQLPGYATVNLLTSYSRHIGKTKVTTQFNVDNLLDKEYYTSNTGTDISPLVTRTFMGSVRVEF
jgi:iron complex outermembrane receptor protein